MAELEHAYDDLPPATLLWSMALGFAAIAGFGWLFVGMRRLFQYRLYMRGAEIYTQRGELDFAERVRDFSGSLIVDMSYAFAAAAVFAFVLIALTRRSWNAWDHATLVAGFAAVPSLIFLCAGGRLMFFLPLTLLPLFGMLYLGDVKAAMGVAKQPAPQAPPDMPIVAMSREEIEREVATERALIAQLGQNLDVFELERGITTDQFVRRYADGLEEESADNAEWFSIARALRRHHERLNELLAQRESLPQENA